ncbi:MAG: PhoH family protein [Methylococcales bacterium]|nr:PhoH family protein [Methylococcales bacterium]
MNIQTAPDIKLFVLDTNVLMHDPAALFRFQEHHLFIPMVVLEELDHGKKGLSEVARNVRQVSRFLDELITGASPKSIEAGIPLSKLEASADNGARFSGRLYFQTEQLFAPLPDSMPGHLPDNSILGIVKALADKFPETRVVLVSKDINMRIKAAALKLNAEDYHNDQTLDDIDLLYDGVCTLEDDFWTAHGDQMTSWQDNSRTFYQLEGPLVNEWYPNQFLYLPGDNRFEAIVRQRKGDVATLELLNDYRNQQHNVWGIVAKNREQSFALNVLLDPNVDFVTLLGSAGTGKTLLALAAGLLLTMDQRVYNEVIMTRQTIPVGEDIGFLPGTEEEKMAPWMGALLDNLEILGAKSGEHTDWEQNASQQLVMNRIKIRSLNFMRGRTFLNRYLIIDEAQNLTAKQMKTLITRAGPGTKIICIGNLAQIDTPYLTATTSGLTYVVDHFKHWPHSAHITLRQGERSRLADYASEVL